MLSQTTHASLLARLRSGSGDIDPAAWHEFHDRYAQLIRGFASRQGVQPVECDDVLQDVLLALTRDLAKFEYDPERGRFRSYLKTVTLHAVFRRLRQNRAAGRPDEAERLAAAAMTDPVVEETWEEQWRQHHLRRALRTVRDEFNDSDLAAFERYVLQGRSVAETGAELGISADQVYQAKSRILRRLTAVIDAQVAEEG